VVGLFRIIAPPKPRSLEGKLEKLTKRWGRVAGRRVVLERFTLWIGIKRAKSTKAFLSPLSGKRGGLKKELSGEGNLTDWRFLNDF
jgi:hypothetical protein